MYSYNASRHKLANSFHHIQIIKQEILGKTYDARFPSDFSPTTTTTTTPPSFPLSLSAC
jgi:hypothetical protein